MIKRGIFSLLVVLSVCMSLYAATTITRGLIGQEDFYPGYGSFTREGSTGANLTLHKIPLITPERYGATGLGVVSDNTAVQAAITAANGEPIYLGGTYIVSNVTGTNVSFYGPGTLKHAASSTDHMLEVSGVLDIRDITIDGNKANQTGRYATIYFTGSSLKARNVTFQNTVHAGILSYDGLVVDVDQCRFLNMAEHGGNAGETTYGIRLTQSSADMRFRIRNSDFVNTAPTGGDGYTGTAVYAHGAQTGKLHGYIGDNYVSYCGQNVAGNNTGAIDLYQLADDTIIENNWIYNSGWSAIIASDSGNVTISNNKIGEPYYATGQSAIYVQGYNRSTTLKHDHSIVDNSMTWSGGAGISVHGASGQLVKGTKIARNRIVNSTRGIYLYYCDGGTIEDNTIETIGASLHGGIVVRASQGTVRVYGNRTYNMTDVTHLYVYTGQTALDMDVVGNEFDTVASPSTENTGVRVIGCRNVRYIGNQHLNSPTYSFGVYDCTGNVIIMGNIADKVPFFTGNTGLNVLNNSWQTTGGFQRLAVEATANIENDASTTITLSIPTSSRLLGVQLRVDSALATGETWDAAWSGGSTTAIASGQAVAKNTKVTVMYSANAASDITTNTTNIAITKNGGGSFTAQGTIRAIAYYEVMNAMSDAP